MDKVDMEKSVIGGLSECVSTKCYTGRRPFTPNP